MAQWDSFARAAPALAAFGLSCLERPPTVSYLGTIAADGLPRVHPVTPIVGGGRLFLFMEPTSPKVRDLRERRVFALHNGVPDADGTGGEFFVRGLAEPVEDPALRSVAAAAASYEAADRYVLFELTVSEARCNGYGDVTLPEPRRWRDPEARAPGLAASGSASTEPEAATQGTPERETSKRGSAKPGTAKQGSVKRGSVKRGSAKRVSTTREATTRETTKRGTRR
jgi:hypothetical protein